MKNTLKKFGVFLFTLAFILPTVGSVYATEEKVDGPVVHTIAAEMELVSGNELKEEIPEKSMSKETESDTEKESSNGTIQPLEKEEEKEIILEDEINELKEEADKKTIEITQQEVKDSSTMAEKKIKKEVGEETSTKNETDKLQTDSSTSLKLKVESPDLDADEEKAEQEQTEEPEEKKDSEKSKEGGVALDPTEKSPVVEVV